MTATSFPTTLQTLLRGAIDYAGLFPPASLSLGEALANYREYRRSSDGWALGRLVVPAARLEELTALSDPTGADGIRVSVTVAGNLAEQLERIEAFNRRWAAGGSRVDAVEAKVAGPAIAQLAAGIGPGVVGYVELPPDAGVEAMAAVGRAGLRGKIRMGGVTAEAFPPPTAVARFLSDATRSGLPFKATAGLHHPLRGEYRLTYQPASVSGTMFGFLNLAVATLLAMAGAAESEVVAALEERGRGAIRVEPDLLAWRTHRFPMAALRGLRNHFDGFGSCSFREPIDELLPSVTE